jgi:hypothetical protein
VGAWGTAIFSDDTALDVREEWREAVLEGLSAEEATARLMQSFDDHRGDDEDTEKLFWMALAAAQFETGRLLPDVRDRALEIIDRGGDVHRWQEDGDDVSAGQRARVLERLAAKLRGPQPKPKRLRRPPDLTVPFEVGDVIHVYDEDKENEALVVVVGHVEETRERHPVVAALDWEEDMILEPGALSRLPVLRDHYAPDRHLLIAVLTNSKKDVFGPHVGEVVAKSVVPKQRVDPRQVAHFMNWGLVAGVVEEAQYWAQARGTRT